MTDVSLFRLYALRAGYLFVAAGLAATVWPLLINHSPQWPLMNSVVCSMLAAVSVLAALGFAIRCRCCRSFSSRLPGRASG